LRLREFAAHCKRDSFVNLCAIAAGRGQGLSDDFPGLTTVTQESIHRCILRGDVCSGVWLSGLSALSFVAREFLNLTHLPGKCRN